MTVGIRRVQGPQNLSNQPRLKVLPGEDQTVLIAGGAGFLGSSLCAFYVSQRVNVICLDNLSTGRMENIKNLIDAPQFTFIWHDVTQPFKTGEGIDFIYNLACPASPFKYQADPIKTFHTIVVGSENLLLLAALKEARILEASTSEVYGDPEVSSQSETYRGSVKTMGPRACYDEGKRAAETLFFNYHEYRGVDTRVARIFNTYGPGMDSEDGRVVSNFVTKALKGEPLTIYGDGTQTRSFCFVDDMIDGLVALMHTEGDLAMPVNLGNPGEFSMLALAEMVLEETGAKSDFDLQPLPKDDPKIRRPDICRAQQVLCWEPQVSLREGLRLTIPYFAGEIACQSAQQEAVRVY